MSDVSGVEKVGSASGRQKVATVDVDEAFETHTFSFVNGPKGQAVPALEFNLSSFTADLLKRLASHGVVQKVRDSYAGVKGDSQLAYQNAKEVLDNLLAGVWSTRGESEGTGGQGAMYIEAIAKIKGLPLEIARSKVAAMSDEWKKAAQKDPQIVAVVAQIKLERAQAAVDKARATASDQPTLNLGDLDSAA